MELNEAAKLAIFENNKGFKLESDNVKYFKKTKSYNLKRRINHLDTLSQLCYLRLRMYKVIAVVKVWNVVSKVFKID